MFSGIVETIGIITALQFENNCKHFTIAPALPFNDISIGDSIAVNGVCLTVIDFTDTAFTVTAVPETLRLTNLDYLNTNNHVNLERSLKVGQRISGHFVQGHIDNKGQIIEVKTDNHSQALLVKISTPSLLAKYIVAKGYITLDGMSITVIEAADKWFTITLIPHTQAVTIAKHYAKDSYINIEVDMIGKYIEKIAGAYTHANTN